MSFIFKNASVFSNGKFVRSDILVDSGIVAAFSDNLMTAGREVIDLTGKYIFPGFVDVHVHLREPGFSYKETITSGTRAAAHGGYTTVCSMPNLRPVPDSSENLALQQKLIDSNAVINVYPYGSITVGEEGNALSDMESMAEGVVAFSDDGKGVQSEAMMESAMLKAKSLRKIIAAHCEDNSLLNGGYIHAGNYAFVHGHKGISSESEWRMVERDVRLAEKTGAAYHVCHISTRESVEIIREAKSRGVDITCETAPHYLTLSDADLQEHGRFKMNPPLRDETDRLALIEGIKDGTVDMIATDHAPHSPAEKSKGLAGSFMGVSGLECAFPVLYTKLVRTGEIPLSKLIELMSVNPGRRFKIGSSIKMGMPASFTVFDLDSEYAVDPSSFLSMGTSTPFEGMQVYGKCLMTLCNGKQVWKAE